MALKFDTPHNSTLKPKVIVFGVGGAGGNAVNNMIRSNLEGVEFVAANTDAQALSTSLAPNLIQLGLKTTKGLGAGSFPDRGRAAAEESSQEIDRYLEGANMIFIAAGMGGGTGTGAAPIIAKLAKEKDILTVGVVTKPFHFEGKYRMEGAERGVDELKKYVDTLIIIPNQNLFRIVNEQTTFEAAFKMADDVLHAGVRGVTDLITMPGLVNLDFADIRTIMTKMGKAMMGTGEATGENRAMLACEAAISNPLLDDVSISGARSVMVNMTGGPDLTLFEADLVVSTIKKQVDPEANIIFGSAFNEDMKGKIRVSVVATGIDSEAFEGKRESKRSKTEAKAKFAPKEEPKKDTRRFFDVSGIEEVEDLEEISANDVKPAPRAESAWDNLALKTAPLKSESEHTQGEFFPEAKSVVKSNLKTVTEAKVKKKKEPSGFNLFSFMNSKNKKEEEAEEIDDNETAFKEEKKRNPVSSAAPNLITESAVESEDQERISEDDINIPAFFRRSAR